MSVRIEKLIAEYPDMVRDRKCLAYQIAHFRGLSAEEVIESMYRQCSCARHYRGAHYVKA